MMNASRLGSLSPMRACRAMLAALAIAAACSVGLSGARAEERRQNFDADPGWDGLNNRPKSEPRTVKQDFGFSASRNASREPGEIGGLVSPAGEPAWHAKKIPTLTFNDKFSATGAMVVKKGAGNTLIGFFNSRTANEWRTANSLAWRINGRGETFHAHFEYATSKWRAGAGIIGRYDKEANRMHPNERPSGDAVYPWSLSYDPDGEEGGGKIIASLGEITATTAVPASHKADGASFDRFGILNVIKSLDSPGEIWIGDLTINGERQDLSRDPQWEGRDNRRTYDTDDVRPWFNFGHSASHRAGGAAPGELGGRVFRGDCREAARLGYYGDPVGPLTLDKPLRASGKVAMLRGVSDSTALLGFFHHEKSVRVNPSQKDGGPANFLGFAIEGPSPEGFYFYPAWRAGEGDSGGGRDRNYPRIYPDGVSHDWTLEYDPAANDGIGAITLSLDGQAVTAKLKPEDKAAGATFDRFGWVTPWIDGNAVVVYYDDLAYTSSQR